jgi:hypothetical protein
MRAISATSSGSNGSGVVMPLMQKVHYNHFSTLMQ